MTHPSDRFLPGVPGREIERLFSAAPGNELTSGKFDSPISSAALAANTFGFFLNRARKLPPLPECAQAVWPAHSVSLETPVRFPWSGGRHPVLDCLVVTPTALIGIESKRFEPFYAKKTASFSAAYWRSVWGARMRGYEGIRDTLRSDNTRYAFLDAAQLVKHAFALRSAVHRPEAYYGLTPILFYVYTEPECWPDECRPVEAAAKNGHRAEIERFAKAVAGDEVCFVPCSYRRLLDSWERHPDRRIRAHADVVRRRFSP